MFAARSERVHSPAVQILPPAAPKRFAPTPRLAFAAGVVVAGVLAGVLYLWFAMTGAGRIDPAVREAWGTLLKPGSDVTIMVGSPGIAGLISSNADAPPLGLNMFPAPEVVANWERRLKAQGYSHFPPASQVVVRCSLDGFSALNSVYEAHQVLDRTPVIE